MKNPPILTTNVNKLCDKRVAILVMGRTASGKTTTAKQLSEVLDCQYIPCAYYKRLVKAEYEKNDSLNDNLRDEGGTCNKCSYRCS